MKRSSRVIAVLSVVCAFGAPVTEAQIFGKPDGSEIITVRLNDAQPAAEGKQGLPIFQGISGKTAGAKAISMTRVVIPPKASAKAHIHKGYETAIYLVQGRVETKFGAGLGKSIVNVAGDFIYIPAGVPHQPHNLSDTQPAIAIVARTDPNEQESVELYPPQQKP